MTVVNEGNGARQAIRKSEEIDSKTKDQEPRRKSGGRWWERKGPPESISILRLLYRSAGTRRVGERHIKKVWSVTSPSPHDDKVYLGPQRDGWPSIINANK